jgi:hypothetical protein
VAAAGIATTPPPSRSVPISVITHGVPVKSVTVEQYNQIAHESAPTHFLFGNAGGYEWGQKQIILTEPEIANIQAVGRRKPGTPITRAQADAVFILSHEIGHSTGIFDEHQTDLYAAGHLSQVAYQLGVRSPANFAALQTINEQIAANVYGPIPHSAFH